ncbi:MAG: small multi-drug export protein [Evtepia sp.]
MEENIIDSIWTVLIGMTPILEIRGAIPYGLAQGLPLWEAFFWGFIGNLLPIPIIILFTRHVLNWLRRFHRFEKMIDWLEQKAHMKGRVVNRYKTLGLFVLVAIPLPGTGAWTGGLVAAVFDIRMRNAMPAISLGVLAAGVIVMLVSVSAILTFGG